MQQDSVPALKQKTAIYIRVSTQFQVDKDSLKVQRKELITYTDIILGIKDYEVFEDPGYSAKNTDRPDYQRMLNRLRAGEFSHLLVWKIDRISRNLLDFAALHNELKQIGVTFVSKNEQFDTSTAIGEAMLKIILVFAELERKMTAERVTAVMLSRATSGKWNGGHVPYGYDWNKQTKEISVNQKEAAIYREICDLYEDHQSLLAVSRILNEKGYVTKRGGAWNPVGVHKVLTNVWYEGIYRYNVHSDGKGNVEKDPSEWINVENHHPALIDDVRFDRINYMLTRNVRRGFRSGDTLKSKNIHIFAGILSCGDCGGNMTANSDKRRASGWRPSIYGCSSIRRKTKACESKFVSDAKIAPIIFGVIAGILSVSEGFEKARTVAQFEKVILGKLPSDTVSGVDGLDGFIGASRDDALGMKYEPKFKESGESESKEDLIARKNKAESSLKRLQSIYLYGDGVMAEKDYILERTKILSTLEDLEKRIAALERDEELFDDEAFREKASYFLMVETLLKYERDSAEKLIRAADPEVIRAFMRRIIGRIVVTSGKVTEIAFRNEAIVTLKYE